MAGPRDVVQLQVVSHVSPAVLVEGVQLRAAIVTWLTRDACLHHTGQSHELVHAFDASVALSNCHYGVGLGDGQYFGELCDEGRMAVHSIQSGSAESAWKLSEILAETFTAYAVVVENAYAQVSNAPVAQQRLRKS
ncbi:hypothetical protein MRX96_050523 [Rhipicephalus microplus]